MPWGPAAGPRHLASRRAGPSCTGPCREQKESVLHIIGVDTGGTFTDLIYQDESGNFRVEKLLSTPANPAEAVLEGLSRLYSGGARQIVHGSTVATNAILERKGVKTALITNNGFTDVIEIGRQNRFRLYDLHYNKEPHIVPGELRFAVSGRMDKNGEELEPVDLDEIRETVRTVKRAGAESAAVCLLFSFANPAHERAVGDALAEAGLPHSLSHRILAEFREFERTSTTLVNAYVSPKMQRYISYVVDRLNEGDSLRIMQSNGGSISAETAMHESVKTILSGPAGGVVGAREIGAAAGFDKVITFDMGGTSTDVSLIDGKPTLTLEASISGYPVKTPMLDIHTVGAGGGSIAYMDSGGSLAVGPESAGADPGPICYGKGENVTVTDANLYLGRLIPEHFLGGRMKLDTARLDKAMNDLAAELSITPAELAEGILSVANTNMERAIRVISVERGHDPREFALLSFGGAGGMHAAYLARLLNMSRVFVPVNPGILSALGMLMADVIKDYSRTVMLGAADVGRAELDELFAPLEQRGTSELVAEGVSEDDVSLERYLDMRYEGQSFEIIVPLAGDPVEAFHAAHEKAYGYRNENKPVQMVNIRLRARGTPKKPSMPAFATGDEQPDSSALLSERDVIFEGRALKTSVYDREKLKPGNVFAGPAVIVEYTSTILVPPFARARVDKHANLILDIEQ